MSERAISVPFDSTEIIDIAVGEFRRRLMGLSPLQGNKEYPAFDISFSHVVKLRREAEDTGAAVKETLAWGAAVGGDMKAEGEVETITVVAELHRSTDPNTERLIHDLPLTVESPDGKGGKTRRKVKVKDDGK